MCMKLEDTSILEIENMQVLGINVLVQRIDEAETTASGIFLGASAEKDNKNFLANDTFLAKVLKVGEAVQMVKPGDLVYCNKFFVKWVNVKNIAGLKNSEYGLLEERGGIYAKISF